jgi:hypothetical protein
MPQMINIREASKVSWESPPQNGSEVYPGDTNIQLGCLMRIADATEKMAGNYIQMENELKLSKERIDKNTNYIKKLERRVASYQGVITKMKKAVKARIKK